MEQIKSILCSVCEGDPQRSVSCKTCGGAGIGIPSNDGFLVWTEPITFFSIRLRKIRHIFHILFHVFLFTVAILSIATFFWQITKMGDATILADMHLYTAGYWYVSLLWFGLLLLCYCIFRVSEFTEESKQVPGWGISKRQLKKGKTVSTTALFHIAPYFSAHARDIIEDAYKIAQTMNRSDITPITLFASCLTSAAGNTFMTRLGMRFDTIKGPLSKLLSQGVNMYAEPQLTLDAKRILAQSFVSAQKHERQFVDALDIFTESFNANEPLQNLLDQIGFPPDHIRNVCEWLSLQSELRENHARFFALATLKPRTVMNRSMTARQTVMLDRYSEDLTWAAASGYIPPVIGREKQIEEVLRGIESGNRSVALVGEHGVGRQTIIEGIARKMVEEDVPSILFDKRLVSVSLPHVISGGDPSLATERFLSILQDAEQSGNIILVLNGMEALTQSGNGGTMDMAEILSTEISRGNILAILSTTPSAWTAYIEKRSLGSKLVKVHIPEMNVQDVKRVLMSKSGSIEWKQRVFFSYAALDKAATLADRFIHDTANPAKALDVLRESAVVARTSRGENTFVTIDDVAKVVHGKTGVPVESVTVSEREKLLKLEDHLHTRVIGQDEAVTAVSQALRRARAELSSTHRPLSNFLFLGPTGVGKTELTKALAAEYFGSEDAMIRVDMSEYQDKSSIDRMIGAPGDQSGGLLTEAVRKKPFAIVLLDELEKAHPEILNLFLQVMDDGRLTDGVGRTVDFTNTIVIATSNAGSAFIQSEIAANAPVEEIKRGLLERELKGIFRPEFLNRFDGVIVFKPLTFEDVVKIAKILLLQIAKKIEAKGMSFSADDEAISELATAGFDPQFGARPLRRAIQERVDNLLANLLLEGKVARKDHLHLIAGGHINVEKAPEI